MIAALFVRKGGAYYGIPDVDPWPVERDARLYAGAWPVVAHPPCSRWCQLAYVNQKRYGHKVGDDGGCFAAALDAVRRWGGVLEHPAFTHAWPAFQLARPPRAGWAQSIDGGWVCQVAQVAYGHRARKMTWLYYSGARPPPPMIWTEPVAQVLVGFMANRGGRDVPRIHQTEAASTPPAFRDALLNLARWSRPG